MRILGLKKWEVLNFDKQLAKELAEECDIDPIVALIASARGYTDPYELEQFLSDEPIFSNPLELADIELAAEIINNSIEQGEKIAIYGDYDCDGVTATALLYNYLKSRNANCCYYIPDRFEEGYGMNVNAVKKLFNEHTKLIVTVDNGIVCFEEIALAKELGMKVVVTDHHLPIDKLPDADAVVDPHRKDCSSTFKEICGAEVAFKLICVLENREPEELLPYFADILSLAVTADIMPLVDENRSILKYGIEKIKTSALTGISALLTVAGIEIASVNASRIAFGLCPRINAAGRMGKAERAVELLSTDNMMTALGIANEIDAENSKRQQIEKKILEEATMIIETKNYMYDRVIIVSGEGWHHGVIGIVAARLTERYGSPVILLSIDGDTASGSGRSIEGFSLYNAIDYCRDLMIKFGGHEQAAGITLKSEDIPEFRRKINEYANTLDYVPPVLKLDCKLNPSALSLDLAFAIRQLEPFGAGNKLPLFGVFGVTLERITPISNNKHLRLLFSKGNNSFQGLLFGISTDDFCFKIGDCLDLAVNVEANYYKGDYSVSVLIKAVRINGTDDESLFESVAEYNNYMANRDFNVRKILPTREEVGVVYKKICEEPVLEDRIKYIFINSLGYAKTCVSLTVLEELGLILKNEKGIYKAVTGLKTNLNNSQTFKNLIERSGKID